MDYFLSVSLVDIALPEEPPRELFGESDMRSPCSRVITSKEPLKDLIIAPIGPKKFLDHKRLMISYHAEISLEDCKNWISGISSRANARVVSFCWVRRRKMTHVFVTWNTYLHARMSELQWQGETPTLRQVRNKGQVDRVEDFMKGY